ncbi:EamA family transporter [Comamonas sp. CMM01]|uniref:O-acetylserine/cysteine exporter n=2 Tax=Comamonas terrigena TaxID=32013 RepID=A0A2A7UYC5_COMTR|nr:MULTISPECIES: EamA family transporter [Comamonas]MBD9532160.1 EamA family transporter [Comamonas sp. CMM01]MBV7420030.1 EamA family transporter [Comamonas sp. CMM03]MDH0050731.1 EamA family transporter [Comamonas terrigena]MDH0509799.1 EamA family transporter [Comamonas terrigena]MDH1089822.1 EamA family transporter [Comamonas terrigena]
MTSASPSATAGMSRADWLSALIVIVVWGLNFVVMKWGLATLSPLLLCALRFVAASLPFLLFVRPPRNLSWGLLAAYGLVQGVGQFGLLFTGMKLGMPAGMASVVLQTQAFITMLMAAALLGEKPQRWQWIGLTVAIAGLVLIGAAHGDGASQMTLLGFLFTVGAAAMWASSNLLTRMAAKQGPYEPVSFIVWTSLFPIVPLLLLSLWLDGADQVAQQLQAIGVRELGVIAYLAFLSTLLGYGLWTRLLQRYAASTVAPLSLLVPVIGLLSAMLLLGEFPTALQWLGTAGVLLGMVVNQFGGKWLRR